MNNKIICPICKKELGRLTITHLKTHNLSFKDFRNIYPNFNCNSKYHCKQISITHKNKEISLETRNKIKHTFFKKNHTPWNKNNFGQFNHSEESINKIKLSMKKYYENNISKNKGKKHSEEHKRKIGLASKGRKHSEETKQKLSASRIGSNNPFFGKKHTKESIEQQRQKIIGEKNYLYKKTYDDVFGVEKSNELRNRLSKIHINNIKNKKEDYNKKYKYNHNYFRSSWETKVAKWLDKENIRYEYESKKCIFELDNDRHTIVDFYLPELNKYIEVKGYWDNKSINKFNEVKQKIDICIIDVRNINNINLNVKEIC